METMKSTRARALAWRYARQYLADGAGSAVEAVRRVVAVPTWPADPELAVGRRLAGPRPGVVEAGLAEGTLVRTWSFRGAVHLMATDTAPTYLVLRCAARQWELPSWRRHYGLEPGDWPALRGTVRAALAGGPRTPAALATHLARKAQFRQVAPFIDRRDATFLKPFAWQGDLVLGRGPGGQLLLCAPPSSWGEWPALEDAGRDAVRAYLDAYGPATAGHLQRWLGEGLGAGRRRIQRWIDELSTELTEVDIEGAAYLHLGRQVDALADTAAGEAGTLALLPAYDPWTSGPGTADPWLIAPERRPVATAGAHLVVRGGRACGTWKTSPGRLAVRWFPEAGEPPRGDLAREATRLATMLRTELAVEVAAC